MIAVGNIWTVTFFEGIKYNDMSIYNMNMSTVYRQRCLYDIIIIYMLLW